MRLWIRFWLGFSLFLLPTTPALAANTACGLNPPPAGAEFIQEFIAKFAKFYGEGRHDLSLRTELEAVLGLMVRHEIFAHDSEEIALYRAFTIAGTQGKLAEMMKHIVQNGHGALGAAIGDPRFANLQKLSFEQQNQVAVWLSSELKDVHQRNFARPYSAQSETDKRMIDDAIEALTASFSVSDLEKLMSFSDLISVYKLFWRQSGAKFAKQLIEQMMSDPNFKTKAITLSEKFNTERPGRAESEKKAIALLRTINPVKGRVPQLNYNDLDGVILAGSQTQHALWVASNQLLFSRILDGRDLERMFNQFGEVTGRKYQVAVFMKQPLAMIFSEFLYLLHSEGDLEKFATWLATFR